MQHPDGSMTRLVDPTEADALREKLEELTDKPHPVFAEGEILEIKGGKWKVHKILSHGRMVLKTVPY